MKFATLLSVSLMLAAPAWCAEIVVPGYDGPKVWTTIAVPAIASDSAQTAVDADGNRYPVTVRNGEGVVTLPTASQTQVLELKPTKKKDLKKAVTVSKRDGESIIDVEIGGKPFTTYYFSNENHKSYLWPVNAEGDVSVTRDWPMGEQDKSKDHPHHQSFWTSYGDVNGSDYWEFSARSGYQTTVEMDYGSGGAYGWIDSKLVWQDKDHKPVIDEHREYRFYDTPAAYRMFDLTIHLTATYGDVQFGDTKEGGLAGVRMADALRERGGSGTITNSEGGVGAGECWGKPAAWCDYSGTLRGVGKRGMTIMDHPDSFRYPTHWHVRDYGLMGANAFGYSYFYDKKKNGEHLLKKGDTMTFKYRIYVHSGDVNEAHVADTYALFKNPLKAAVK
jgi:Family of unknown function (DUF6807)